MNYLSAILGIALLAAITSAAVFRGNAAEWHEKYTSLQSSYQIASQQAKDDAALQEAKDLATLKSQSSQAISQAQSAQTQAEKTKQAYEGKLKALAGQPKLDLPHLCANQPIPSELIP